MWQTSSRSDRLKAKPLIVAVLLAVGVASRAALADPPGKASSPPLGEPTAEAREFFETHIRPVLVEKCYQCHSENAKIVQGGLRLDTAERLRAGGDSGPVVAPSKPEESLLISAIRYESYEMPPTGKLPDEVIADFVKWVELGAPDPRIEARPVDPGHSTSADPRSHWAFQSPQRVEPPVVNRTDWPRGDVDRFILARLEAAKIIPSPPAAPRALLRRLSYDLTGLPSTAEELDAFAADPSDAQYEAAVDRLLASPRFGERWARYWLDVARYSDTKGYLFQEDRNYKHAYTYRDWVIASFNNDLPYDRFIIAQLAADQLDDKSCAPAIGYLTLGRRYLNNIHDIINDRIDVVSRGMLGLTVACARCHDHKFDPISADDYYAMYSVFLNSDESPRDDAPPALSDTANLKGQVVFLRGKPGNNGPAVERHFLSVLTKEKDAKPPAFQHGSGRREMAEAIASRENPLTARVWVNRIWSHLLGEAIVSTTSDFGTRGNAPTHPELLDWLAVSFMDDGWSTKRLVRKLVLSSTYRQASGDRPDCTEVDPENQLLWRANRRRLDLEAMRDSLLAAAGRLDATLGGPSVQLTTAPFSTRRSVYGFIERQNLPMFFRTFDFANPNTHTPERAQTVSPQQALFLLNSPFVMEQATHLAARSKSGSIAAVGVAGVEPPASPQTNELGARQGLDPSHPTIDAAAEVRRINTLFRYALGREATAEEIIDSLEFVAPDKTAPEPLIARQITWQFGYGSVDEATNKVTFQPLPHFTGQFWQGGDKLPDPKLGWVFLNATGGHPGTGRHEAIRRWVAPFAGTIQVDGSLVHGAEQGDGVRGRVISSRHGLVAKWDVTHGEAATATAPIAVEPGDTIDFVVDGRSDIQHDTFNWVVNIQTAANEKNQPQVWDSPGGFHGPLASPEPPLTRWEQLAQTLLMSNEFIFVD